VPGRSDVGEGWTVELVGLWRYPVKSLQGERVESASFEVGGVVGDREWGIRDERTGRILTARRRPELLAARAGYDGDVPVITLPDGRTAVGPGPATDRLLTEWLEAPVSLVSPLGTAGGRAEYFADATDDSSEAIEWTMPAGRYVDAAPVLVLTTASLRTGSRLHPGGVWDARRFRPNALIDVDGDGWLEDEWVGGSLQLGAVGLRPVQPCVRCTMVTRAQPGLDADVDVFRTLARNHGGLFGVWSDVLRPGTAVVGDPASVPAVESDDGAGRTLSSRVYGAE
jgi:MOSC domain-containing protein